MDDKIFKLSAGAYLIEASYNSVKLDQERLNEEEREEMLEKRRAGKDGKQNERRN